MKSIVLHTKIDLSLVTHMPKLAGALPPMHPPLCACPFNSWCHFSRRGCGHSVRETRAAPHFVCSECCCSLLRIVAACLLALLLSGARRNQLSRTIMEQRTNSSFGKQFSRVEHSKKPWNGTFENNERQRLTLRSSKHDLYNCGLEVKGTKSDGLQPKWP